MPGSPSHGVASNADIATSTGLRGRSSKTAEHRHVGFRWLKREAGLAGERDAEALFRTVARHFGRRIGKAESRHVAAHLPLGLREIWDEETAAAGKPQAFGRTELVASVAHDLGIDAPSAEVLVAIVFAWLKHLAPEETCDVSPILPARLRQLWEEARLPVFPPWRDLALIPPVKPTPVRFVVLEEGAMRPSAELNGTLFTLPARGMRLWHAGRPYVVERVVEGETTRIVLIPDPALEACVRDELPPGFRIQTEQRRDDTWSARVLDDSGRLLAVSSAERCDEAVEAAVAEGLRLLAGEDGYQPGHEIEWPC